MSRELMPPTSKADYALLLFGLLGGAAAWFAHLAVGYTLVMLPCTIETGDMRPILYLVTVVAALIALAASALAGWRYRNVRRSARHNQAEEGGMVGFLAATGLMLSLVSFLAILLQSAALPYLEFCGS